MDYKDIDFPQYRKLINDKSFYCILDGRNFEEIQIIGSKMVKYQFLAAQYPEMLRIKDMIDCSHGYINYTRSEFNELRNQVKE